MNQLPTKYYVYFHIDPKTHEVLYVGKGTGGRAWDTSRSRKYNPEHIKWLQNKMKEGYIPTDYVVILDKGLTETEAFKKEKEYLHKNGNTKFNRTTGENNHQAKLTDEEARQIFLMCKDKEDTHKKIAEKYGVSRAAVSMIASRKQWKTATAGL